MLHLLIRFQSVFRISFLTDQYSFTWYARQTGEHIVAMPKINMAKTKNVSSFTLKVIICLFHSSFCVLMYNIHCLFYLAFVNVTATMDSKRY